MSKIGTLIILMLLLPIFLSAATVKDEIATAKAVFAGGCFWCIEAAFDSLDGVEKAVSGYTGGKVKNPTYKEVSTGETGHLEAVKIIYNPKKTSYRELLDVFWKQIDPTDDGGQFADRGSQYRTAIFYFNEEQKSLAVKSKEKLEQSEKFDSPIVTEIREAEKFYKAEKHHQNYAKECPLKYKSYKKHSGRKDFIEETWEKE